MLYITENQVHYVHLYCALPKLSYLIIYCILIYSFMISELYCGQGGSGVSFRSTRQDYFNL